jgi:predicted DCC family thiol-disulfide oxidoreductase YuxK
MKKNVIEHPVILFDGICNLCNQLVNFVILHDPKAKFRFAALQSAAGQKLLGQLHLPLDDFNTFILVESNRYHKKSTAALRVLKELNGLWSVFYVFVLVPSPIRNFFYNIIANNRYQFFGKREQCLVPTPDIKKRFL